MKKKVGNYLAARDELEAKYSSLISQADPSIKDELSSLKEFDFLNYSYIALKSYYEISKCKWDLDYRNLLDDLASVNARIESKLSIRELCFRMPGLSVLRRELRERAREAGKISHLMITSSANPQELASIVNEVSGPYTAPVTEDSTNGITRATPKVSDRTDTADRPSPSPSTIQDTQIVREDLVSQSQKTDLQPFSKDLSASGKLNTPQASSLSDSDGRQYRSSSILDLPIQIEALDAQESSEKTSDGLLEKPDDTRDSNTQRVQAEASHHQVSNESSERPKQKLISTDQEAMPSSNLSRKRSSDEPGLSQSAHKRPQVDCAFVKMRTWTREHVKCVVSGAYSNDDPKEAISKAFKSKFRINLTGEEVDTLRLHYGLMEPHMEGYRYNIQSFHAVATYFYDNMTNYVVIPWTEMRLQYARKTNFSIPDWEIKNRYYLFLLHRKVYGKLGEPASNYHDLVSAFHRINGRLTNSKLPSPVLDSETPSNSNKTTSASLTGSSNLASQKLKLSYNDTSSSKEWTPKDVEALIEAEHKVPATVNYRSSVVMHYIKLKTGHAFTLDEIQWRRSQDDVVKAIQKKATNNTPTSTAKTSNKVNKEASKDKISPIGDDKKSNIPIIPTQPATNQFDILLKNIAAETRDDPYYRNKFPEKILTDFWDFCKTKSLVSTIEYISLVDPQTKDVTLRVARLNMIKIAMLRLLRDHQVKILAELIENRLKRMMEMDVFDEALCTVINEHLHK